IRDTIPLEEAVALLLEAGRPIERTERAALHDASGRIVADPPASTMDVPPFDRAAMDGYAVRAEDTFGAGRYDPKILRCVEKVYTGQMPSRAIAAGECTEIATGAPLPKGADAVVMVEETERAPDEAAVRIFTPVYPRQHVGRRAADIAIGQKVLEPGDVLTPSRIGALAAIGAIDVSIFARPRIAILSTGNEIVEPGQPLAAGQIYDINRFTLASIISAHGGVPGYPTSCLSNSYMLLIPMLRRMARLPPHQPQIARATLTRRVVSTTGRHQFYTVRIVDGRAEPAFKASGDITSMAHADGYIE